MLPCDTLTSSARGDRRTKNKNTPCVRFSLFPTMLSTYVSSYSMRFDSFFVVKIWNVNCLHEDSFACFPFCSRPRPPNVYLPITAMDHPFACSSAPCLRTSLTLVTGLAVMPMVMASPTMYTSGVRSRFKIQIFGCILPRDWNRTQSSCFLHSCAGFQTCKGSYTAQCGQGYLSLLLKQALVMEHSSSTTTTTHQTSQIESLRTAGSCRC
jgi:hypothetical protein